MSAGPRRAEEHVLHGVRRADGRHDPDRRGRQGRPGRAEQCRDADDRLHQGALVILFFMHVRWSRRLTWVVAMPGFFWLLILFGVTMTDYMTRGWVPGTLR